MTALAARRRGQAHGQATRRQQKLARVAEQFRVDLAPLMDRVPIDELIPIAARIYLAGYDHGYHRSANDRRRTLVEVGGQSGSE